MNPQDLSAAASLLYGKEWQRPLSRCLAIDDRLVRRWKAGDRPIPVWVQSRLEEELTKRLSDINDLLEEWRVKK